MQILNGLVPERRNRYTPGSRLNACSENSNAFIFIVDCKA